MKESEFWNALELAFGSTTGRSLATDLHLTAFDSTAVQALEAGMSVNDVWVSLIEESGADPKLRWVHRRPLRRK